MQVVQPETILRWHRAGFKAFWRWKSRNRAGRPKVERELRDLIRRMSSENPLWAARRSASPRATLASGTGMRKTAKLHGVGSGTVQRISRELAT